MTGSFIVANKREHINRSYDILLLAGRAAQSERTPRIEERQALAKDIKRQLSRDAAGISTG